MNQLNFNKDKEKATELFETNLEYMQSDNAKKALRLLLDNVGSTVGLLEIASKVGMKPQAISNNIRKANSRGFVIVNKSLPGQPARYELKAVFEVVAVGRDFAPKRNNFTSLLNSVFGQLAI